MLVRGTWSVRALLAVLPLVTPMALVALVTLITLVALVTLLAGLPLGTLLSRGARHRSWAGGATRYG